MTRRHPSLELTRLLELLSKEILDATDEEIREISCLQGWTIANIALEVREVIKAVHADVNGSLDRNFGLNEELSKPGARLQPTGGGRGSSNNQRH